MCLMLNDKVVVITGGAGLIGQAFVRCVAAHGAIVIVADMDKQAGSGFIEVLKTDDPQAKVEFMEVDITSKVSIMGMISVLHDRYDRIDSLVNNAYPRNSRYGRNFEDVTFEDFCDNVSKHLGGYFLMSQQLGMYFRKQGYGNIVNMASIYGVVAPRFEVYDGTSMTMPVEYAAIKSAVIHLTKYMSKYFKGDNIRVNCISPGGILAGQPEPFLARYREFAMSKGMLDPQDISGTLLYLLSDLSAYVNGQNIIVDDGWSL